MTKTIHYGKLDIIIMDYQELGFDKKTFLYLVEELWDKHQQRNQDNELSDEEFKARELKEWRSE